MAKVYCMDDVSSSRTPTWREKLPNILFLKIRMSKDSQIKIYNKETGKREEFVCKKENSGDFNGKTVTIYSTIDLKKEINKIYILYFCYGDILKTSFLDDMSAPYVGILVLKGQIKVDDTSDEPISCMEGSDRKPIWSVEEDEKLKVKGKKVKKSAVTSE